MADTAAAVQALSCTHCERPAWRRWPTDDGSPWWLCRHHWPLVKGVPVVPVVPASRTEAPGRTDSRRPDRDRLAADLLRLMKG